MKTIDLLNEQKVGAIIDDLRKAMTNANSSFERSIRGDPFSSDSDVAWVVEVAFLKLLTVTEVLNLNSLRELLLVDIKTAKSKKDGFSDSLPDPDGDGYLIWISRFRQYMLAIEVLAGTESEHSVTKDLTEILRATEYPITDTHLFGKVPQSEADVHRRIEGVLRCVFPDLKHKPQLTKPIKNFEPDTGLPSIQTLIEYKYISKKQDVASIADEILADTRGYHSRDWTTFVYVIYETNRFRPENEWNQMIRECGITNSTSIIVLSGEPPKQTSQQG